MTEHKKTTYRYSPEFETTINKGLKMFAHTIPSGNMSINQLINTCLDKAINENPAKFSELEQNYRDLISENQAMYRKIESLQETLQNVYSLLNTRREIEEKLNILANNY